MLYRGCTTRQHTMHAENQASVAVDKMASRWHQVDPWLASGMLVAGVFTVIRQGPCSKRVVGPVQQTADRRSSESCERRSPALYEVSTWALPPLPYVPR
jgi:hypothetical protein